MKKLLLSQAEVDKLISVDRIHSIPTVLGVAHLDVIFQVKVDGRELWQYSLWRGMLSRCFCQKFKLRQSTYRGVTCCEDWFSFANFFEWVNKEVDYKGKPDGYQFDKDLIIKGNRTYSPEACSFVPQAVNLLLNSSGATRGEWPIGVCLDKRRSMFEAKMNNNGRPIFLGYYDTPEDAFQAYKIAKEAQIKVVALRYKDVLRPAVFESLMNWSIEP